MYSHITSSASSVSSAAAADKNAAQPVWRSHSVCPRASERVPEGLGRPQSTWARPAGAAAQLPWSKVLGHSMRNPARKLLVLPVWSANVGTLPSQPAGLLASTSAALGNPEKANLKPHPRHCRLRARLHGHPHRQT